MKNTTKRPSATRPGLKKTTGKAAKKPNLRLVQGGKAVRRDARSARLVSCEDGFCATPRDPQPTGPCNEREVDQAPNPAWARLAAADALELHDFAIPGLAALYGGRS